VTPRSKAELETRPLKVVHVIGGGDTGGAMTYLLRLLVALREEGCDARLLCLGDGGLAEEATRRGLPCDVMPMGGPWDARVLPELRGRIAKGRWDVVHTHGMRANLPVRAVARSVRPGLPLFTTVHSDLALDYPHALRARAYVMLDRMSSRGVEGFFCVSKALADGLIVRGIPRDRVHVVYPGIELPAETAAAGDPVVGTIARLVAVKDIGLLLEAVDLLRERVAGLRLVVVGDGPERAALERQAAGLGLGAAVEFRGHLADVWPVLRELQVYVLTSVSEGMPIAVLEAMAAGLPVVAAAVGGLPELIEDGITGFLVSRDTDRAATAQALAGKMESLLADAVARTRMGFAARRHVSESFSPAAAAQKTLRCYTRGIAARRGRAGW
jgi:glycosyltransferase involved in cell wall biosynthesis